VVVVGGGGVYTRSGEGKEGSAEKKTAVKTNGRKGKRQTGDGARVGERCGGNGSPVKT